MQQRWYVRGEGSFMACSHYCKDSKKSHHYTRLNASFRADLHWWHSFVSSWNGVSILYRLNRQAPNTEFFIDASGSRGCAALWKGHWFQLPWTSTPSFASASIAPKESFPVILAAGTWGYHWAGKTILCHSDNEAVVKVINTGSCKEPHLAHMMRCLFFVEAKLNFTLIAQHIPGKCNTDADALSRDGFHSFLSSYPQANHLPMPLRPSLVQNLTSVVPNWILPDWIKSFSTSFNEP